MPLAGGLVGAGGGAVGAAVAGAGVGTDVGAVVGLSVAVGIGIVIGVAEGVSGGVDAPTAALLVGGAVTAATIGMIAAEADGPGDRTRLVAVALGDCAVTRVAVEVLGGTVVLACVQAVTARSARSVIERGRFKFHIPGP